MARVRDDFSRWFDVGSQASLLPFAWWEMYWAAAETIGRRLTLMTLAGSAPGVWQQRENRRMVREKAEAGWESARALGRSALATSWWQLMSAQTATLSWPLLLAETSLQTLDVATRPWHRRARANARRLRLRRR